VLSSFGMPSLIRVPGVEYRSMRDYSDTSGARAAIYTRFPTEEQDDAIQLAHLEEYCHRSKWTTAIHADAATGKAGAYRTGLERPLKDARLRRIDVVVVWKLGRFGRSLREILEHILPLDQCGVRFQVPRANHYANIEEPKRPKSS
jgi:DNA invertase Pin-like site-specific DNA recombinase